MECIIMINETVSNSLPWFIAFVAAKTIKGVIS